MASKNLDLKMNQLLKIKRRFWQTLAVTIQGLIEMDMIKGTVQAFKPQTRATKAGAKQYSEGYRKAKMNYMRRVTKGGKLKSFDPSGDYLGRRLYGKKTKLGMGEIGKYLTGMRSVIDNSSTPNMRLTGETIRGLEYKSSTDVSLTMSYKDKDGDKVRYNEEMGRVITTLNEKNQEKVRKQIEDELVKNISEWYRERIVITIG